MSVSVKVTAGFSVRVKPDTHYPYIQPVYTGDQYTLPIYTGRMYAVRPIYSGTKVRLYIRAIFTTLIYG